MPRRDTNGPKSRPRPDLKTRQAIRAAAETRLLRDGIRTIMRAIATQAGVSEKTIYLAYATKANLLREVIQVAFRRDEAPETLAERPEWRAVMAGPPEEVFARFATLNVALMTRTAQIIALAELERRPRAGDTSIRLVVGMASSMALLRPRRR